MTAENSTQSYRAGFVAVAGRPNVGKSTLINAVLRQKIAAVTPRPQTTRRQQLGILTLEHAQIVFIDTPGIHHPRHKLGERMNAEAEAALDDADVLLTIVDGSQPPHDEDHLLAEVIASVQVLPPQVLAVNKIDLIDQETLAARQAAFGALFPRATVMPISAAYGHNLAELLDLLISKLPEHPAFFPEDQITDLYEREIAADLIREAALLSLRDEVPHAIAIRIDEFKERGEGGAYIAATIFVERESQKPIVIGRGGEMIKRIGSMARREIEAMSGRKVFLDLRVKVRKNWRNNERMLSLFGFKGHRR